VIAITANYCEADQTADRRLGVPKNPSRRQFPRGSLPPTGQRPLLFTPLDMDRALAANQNIAVSCQHQGSPNILLGRPPIISASHSHCVKKVKAAEREPARRRSLLCDIRKFCDSDHSMNGKSCDRDHSTNVGDK